MKIKIFYVVMCILTCFTHSFAQESKVSIINGVVLNKESEFIEGATVLLKYSNQKVQTSQDGKFAITSNKNEITLIVSHVGYEEHEISISDVTRNDTIVVVMVKSDMFLEEVTISTGYYRQKLENLTGSVSVVDNNLLNRSVSSNVINRLEGVTNSLHFDRRVSNDTYGDNLSLSVRGLSTIEANSEPLIVLDNFPYEGDINTINPNDVADIYILKDAAASAIWGARAGNGVIVITTKKGKHSLKPNISVSSSVELTEKPDVYYNQNHIRSEDFIGIEKMLFDEGYYVEDNTSKLTPAIELFIKHREGEIDSETLENSLDHFRKMDVRKDSERYLYQNGLTKQYMASINGGNETGRYYFSSGFDNNVSTLKGTQDKRITLRSRNSLSIGKLLELDLALNYVNTRNDKNSMTLREASPFSSLYPYATLADDHGRSLPISKSHRMVYAEMAEERGLLDWLYRPLDERDNTLHYIAQNEFRYDTGIKVKLLKGLTSDIKYQFQRTNGNVVSHSNEKSYYARNLINQFAQDDGSFVIPHGGILTTDFSNKIIHSGRFQLNFDRAWRENHVVSALVGYEQRQIKLNGSGNTKYGYDDENLSSQPMMDYLTWYEIKPSGYLQIPHPGRPTLGLTDRFLSYYSNVNYRYKNRYSVSASTRWDASNLFGVKTNQQGVPLWSVGGLWHLSNENFYNISWLDQLSLRATYGFSGNLDKSVTAFTTASYGTNAVTGLKDAVIISPGNPQLRWEKVRTLNLGLNMKVFDGRLDIGVEHYIKNGKDLLSYLPMDPTVGVRYHKINYADIKTKGFDIEINSRNTKGNIKWNSSMLINFVKDEVVAYNDDNSSINSYTSFLFPTPQIGKPRYSVHTYAWQGLDPETGDPLVLINGEESKNYAAFMNNLTKEELIYHGPASPTYFGSLRNDFSWKRWNFGFNIMWKGGHYFRRNTINYNGLFNSWTGHVDYYDRWQNPGDELTTSVPSMPSVSDASGSRDMIYNMSERMIEKADHIRLHDVVFGYNLKKSSSRIGNIQVSITARNLGILWKATKYDINPDRPVASFPYSRIYSLNLRVGI